MVYTFFYTRSSSLLKVRKVKKGGGGTLKKINKSLSETEMSKRATFRDLSVMLEEKGNLQGFHTTCDISQQQGGGFIIIYS